MKRLVLLLCLVAPLALMAAAPTNNSTYETSAADTVDSQHTTTWFLIDSMVVVKSDTCNTYYTFTGTATLQPDQRLFVGIADTSAGAGTNMDVTDTLELPHGAMGPMTISFGLTYLDSLRSQTDANDSIFFRAAVGGTRPDERVIITSVKMTGTVIDYDAP